VSAGEKTAATALILLVKRARSNPNAWLASVAESVFSCAGTRQIVCPNAPKWNRFWLFSLFST